MASACRMRSRPRHCPLHCSSEAVVGVGADDEDLVLVHPEVQPVQQGGPLGVGHDHGAVGGAHVRRQCPAPPGRVDPDDGRAGQRSAVQPEEVLGTVGEEHADVRLVGADQRAGQRPPCRALQHRLAPGPAPVAVHDPGAIVGGPGGQHGGDGRHDGAQPRARRTRERSMSSTVAAAAEMHGAPQLRLVPAEELGHAVGPARGHRPQRRAPDQGRLCPERQRLHHVGGAAQTAVDIDLASPVDRIHHFGQDVGRGRRVGQLAGAVVGHHDGGRAGLHAAHGVVRPLDALDHDGQITQPGQPLDVVRRERGLELVRDHGHEPTLACAVGAVARQIGQGQVVGQVHADAPFAQPQSRDGSVDRQDEARGSRARRPAAPVPRCAPVPAGCRSASSGPRPVRQRPRPRAGRWPGTTG